MRKGEEVLGWQLFRVGCAGWWYAARLHSFDGRVDLCARFAGVVLLVLLLRTCVLRSLSFVPRFRQLDLPQGFLLVCLALNWG